MAIDGLRGLIQEATRVLLQADSALVAIVDGQIYDEAPNEALSGPVVLLGEMDTLPDMTLGSTGNRDLVLDITHRIFVICAPDEDADVQYRGFKAARLAADKIFDDLYGKTLTLTGSSFTASPMDMNEDITDRRLEDGAMAITIPLHMILCGTV